LPVKLISAGSACFNMRKTLAVALTILFAASMAAGQVSPELQQKLENKPSTEKVPVIVMTDRAPEQANLDEIRGAGGDISHTYELIDGIAVSLPEVAVENMAERAFVREIQPDLKMETVLDKSVEQVNADQVWNMNQTGQGVDVAVVDTGIDNNNSALEVEEEVSFTGTGTDDGNGHGTHVAGIVASQDGTYRGTSYNSDLFDVKVLNENGTGSASNVIEGIEWAVDNEADVISLSMGAQVEECDGTSAVAEAVDNAVQEGVTVVVAAGNSGPENQTISTPGCAEGALTVGSAGSDYEISEFSSRGPTTDGRTKPDLVAPGEGVVSTWEDGSFESKTGTSMSTPHVSGVAAMLLSEEPGLTPGEVKNVTEYTAEDLGYDSTVQGAGLLDAYAAYQAVSGNQTENSTENETAELFPDIELLRPEDGAKSLNDTDDNESVDVDLEFNVSDANDQTLNVTVYMLNDTAVREFSNTSVGLYDVHIENLAAGMTYSWYVTATDRQNSTKSSKYKFTTASRVNETNETRNRTNATLPPGLRDKEELPPAFQKGLPQVGVPPGTPAYGVKRAMEKVSLALTFDPEKKTELRMKFAERRLAEAQALAEDNETEKAEKFVQDYQKQLNQTRQIVEKKKIKVSRDVSERLETPGKADEVLSQIQKKKEAASNRQNPGGKDIQRPVSAGEKGKPGENTGDTRADKQKQAENRGQNSGKKDEKGAENREAQKAEKREQKGSQDRPEAEKGRQSTEKTGPEGKQDLEETKSQQQNKPRTENRTSEGREKPEAGQQEKQDREQQKPEEDTKEGENTSGKMREQENKENPGSQKPGSEDSGEENGPGNGRGPPEGGDAPGGPVGMFFSSLSSLLP
jgi:serine protease AprX